MKRKPLQTFLGVVAFAVSGIGANVVGAAVKEPPPGVTVVHAEDIIALVRNHDGVIIIDSRAPADRELGYIEDSINLPDDQTNCDTLSKISNRLDRPMVFYCNGVACGRSYHAVEKASSCGYSKIYWFEGGYTEWRDKRFPVVRGH